jgi:ribosomal protein L7/L12
MPDMEREIADIRARLDNIETKLGLLFRRLGITLQDPPAGKASPEIMELVNKGDKKAAIRAFMSETGAGLKDAKNFIESLAGEGK